MTNSSPRRVVPETYAQLLYEYLEIHGQSPETLLGAPWPAPDLNGLGGLAVERWAQMLEIAAAHLDDPQIGLHVGQTISLRHLGILGPVLAACDTLGTALAKLAHYQRLIFDVVPMTQRAGPGWVELAWELHDHTPCPLVAESSLAVLTTFIRSLVRGGFTPLAVGFAHSHPGDAVPYEVFFGCPVRFGASSAQVRLDAESLSAPLKSPDPSLMSVLEQHADRLLAQLPQPDAVVAQVRQAIAHALREGEPGIDSISARLRQSSRTLQRRLGAAGTRFRAELNLVRHQLAQSYLKDPRLQIVDIALLLGYSEHSAFTRAFREWTGETPQSARARLVG